ncbi:MAG TPA: hypothetical protein VE399_02940, partial [Gemmatimonadales bacterium]|nr:hypothetical protein [Gemmatimonadales bacterium]
IVELSAGEDHLLELPLHLGGRIEAGMPGTWMAADVVSEEFVHQPERFVPADGGPRVLQAFASQDATLTVHLLFDGELLRALAPGPPNTPGLLPFYVLRSQGRNVRLVTVLESARGDRVVRGVRSAGGVIEVETSRGIDRHSATVEGWEVGNGDATVRLAGVRRHAAPFEPLVQTNRPSVARGVALQIRDVPMLDGTLDGFDTRAPLELDHEDQYRRSEEPYAGPEEFAARAHVNWSDDGLYLAVEVTKPEVFPRQPDVPPLGLDNEPDEIHGDGIQVYFRLPQEETVHGLLIVPSMKEGELITRAVEGLAGNGDSVSGSWRATEAGYTITLGLTPVGWARFRPEEELGFDLLVNQMLPDRTRRAGQLVWSGGGGWVWLRGDRQDPARLGILELR